MEGVSCQEIIFCKIALILMCLTSNLGRDQIFLTHPAKPKV